MKFHEKLKTLRKENELSQERLAKMAKISKRSLILYEQGTNYPRDRDVYNRLAECLGVDTNYLMTEDEEFILDARKKYGYRGAKQAQELVEELTGLFAGGELEEEDMDILANAIQEAYWIAKLNNKKYTPNKYL